MELSKPKQEGKAGDLANDRLVIFISVPGKVMEENPSGNHLQAYEGEGSEEAAWVDQEEMETMPDQPDCLLSSDEWLCAQGKSRGFCEPSL